MTFIVKIDKVRFHEDSEITEEIIKAILINNIGLFQSQITVLELK
jgi:hypothetical protein